MSKHFCRRFLVAATILLSAPASYACYPNPYVYSFDFSDSSTQMSHWDCGGCTISSFTANSSDSSVFSVSPNSVSSGTMTDLTLTPGDNGNATLNVAWMLTGTDSYGYDCSAYNGSSSLSVMVGISSAGSTANFPTAGSDADPVNTLNGEYYFYEPVELNLGGPVPLYFQRYYASYMARSFVIGDLGDNWRHNYEWSMHWNGTAMTLIDPTGRLFKFSSDGAGHWTQQTGTDIAFQVNQGSGIMEFLDPRTNLMYHFTVPSGDTAYRLTSIDDPNGNTLDLTYYDQFNAYFGKLMSVSDGFRSLEFHYTTVGGLYDKLLYVAEVQGGTATGRTTAFTYTTAGAGNIVEMLSVTDAAGNASLYTYATPDGADRAQLTKKQLPEGNYHYSQDYFTIAESQFDSGKMEVQTDANGNTTTFAYSGSNTTMTDGGGNSRSQAHSTANGLAGLADTSGANASFTDDADSRRASITDKLGGTTSYTYHAASGRLASKSDAEGNTTSYTYSARAVGSFTYYDVTAIDYPDGSSEAMVYDSGGNLTTFTDRGGNDWVFTYNAKGQFLTVTNPLGGVATYTYNNDGTLATLKDSANNTYSYAYDSSRRVTTITNPNSKTVSYTYDDMDRILTVTNEAGGITTYGYDTNGNLTGLTDPATNSFIFAYDNMDRLQGVTDRAGNSVSATFDANGRLATLTNKAGEVMSYTYDANGRLASLTDNDGNSWSMGRDLEGVLSGITDPTAVAATVDTDKLGRATGAADGSTAGSLIGRNAMGAITSFQAPDGTSWGMTRDNRGLITQITLPGTLGTVGYQYDAMGKLTQVTDANGGSWQTAYDASGRRTSATDPLSNVTSYTYDTLNRISGVTFPGGGTLTATFDDGNNVTRLLYSDGTDLNLTYDNLGRLTAAGGLALGYDANGDITSSNGITITRDAEGRILTMTLAAGKTVTYGYNTNGLLASITDWNSDVTSFAYDTAGRLTTVTRPNGVTGTYGYDSNGRLQSLAEGSLSTITLTYNSNGLIASAARSVPLAAAVSVDSSSAITVDAAHQNTALTYDGMGRLTADGTLTYNWDLADRLTDYTDGTTTYTMSYDDRGLRTGRSDGTTSDTYLWNYALRQPFPSVLQRSASDLYYYITTPGGDLLYAIDAASGVRYDYHFDESGNTLFVTDSGGTAIASYAYSPFGESLATSGSFDNPFTWQGQRGVMDEGNGLYYVRARYYASAAGQFISREPLKDISPLGINPYQYAYANPLNLYDANGESPADEAHFALFFAEAFNLIDDPSETSYEDDWQAQGYAYPPNPTTYTATTSQRTTVTMKPPMTSEPRSLTTAAACSCGAPPPTPQGKSFLERSWQSSDQVGAGTGAAFWGLEHALNWRGATGAAGRVNTAGTLFSAAYGSYTETKASLERGQTEGASFVNGVGSGLIDAAFGTACAPVAAIDSATGGNASNSMKQAVRVPTAFIADAVNGNSANTRALERSIKSGDLSPAVQEVYECGETWADNGIGGTLSKLYGAFFIGR